MILIFTIKYDYSSTKVIEWLNHYGVRVIRINGDDDIYKFKKIDSTGIYFTNTITNKLVNLKEAKSCWWRRTGISKRHFMSPIVAENSNEPELDLSLFTNTKSTYINDEYIALKEYIFNTIYETCDINLGKPIFNLNRLIVTDIAKKHKFKVPNFEIINNGEQLLNSKNSLGKIVTKAISNGIYEILKSHRFYTYTELVEPNFYSVNKNITFFPSLITELIEKKMEIRTFFIDDQFYSMAIFSQSNEKTKIDFRKYADNKNEPYKLPNEIEQRLLSVFKEIDLNCGSVDLIVDKNDNFVFLEINPVGQYAMTGEPCNYNLDKLIANYLIYGRLKIN
jgi:ATP-GRASP peptide maturase of grasp-with-spasm system